MLHLRTSICTSFFKQKLKMDILRVGLIAIFAGMIYSQRLVILNPEKAEVLEGGSVLLTCLSETSIGLSRWTWSSSNGQYFKIYTDSRRDDCLLINALENNSMYSVHCNFSSTSIIIRNITRNRHRERWLCDYDYGGDSKSAVINVIVPVTSVQLDSTENIISTKENTDVHLSCSTSFARPAPNITWYLTETISGSESQIPLLDNNMVQITNSTEELVSSKNELLVLVNRSFDGHRLYCAASNHPGIIVSSSTIIFDVQFPVASVQLDSTENIISTKENTDVHLSCSTSFARPAPNITWYLTETISGSESQIPLLDNNMVQITNSTDELFYMEALDCNSDL